MHKSTNWKRYKGYKHGHIQILKVKIVDYYKGYKSFPEFTIRCECGSTVKKHIRSTHTVEHMKTCGRNCPLHARGFKKEPDKVEYVKEQTDSKTRTTEVHTRRIYVKPKGRKRLVYGIENIQAILSHKKDLQNFVKHPHTRSPLVIHWRGRHIMVLPYGTVIAHDVAILIVKHMNMFERNWASIPDKVKTKLYYGSNTRQKKRMFLANW